MPKRALDLNKAKDRQMVRGEWKVEPGLASRDAYFGQGKQHRAIEDLDQGIRLAPERALPYANRALAFTLLGWDAEAQQEFEQAVGLGFDRSIAGRRNRGSEEATASSGYGG